MELPAELTSPKKVLINLKNIDQKYFFWCHIRHINPVKTYPERITQVGKKLANDLDYDGVELSVREKDFNKIETRNNICINVFCYEIKLAFPISVSDQKFENSMDLLLITDGDKSHYVYIKVFGRFLFHKIKNKILLQKLFTGF